MNTDTRTSIVMPQEEIEELDKIAQIEDRTRSQLIRTAVRKYLYEVTKRENATTN
jgi:metal-responsive CopG/Arc/MetJ family transcriptional regulator